QLRAEGFNALNHPNFDNPGNASVGSPSILATTFGQSCCATVAPPSTQTIIQTGESARIIQFALKLMFLCIRSVFVHPRLFVAYLLLFESPMDRPYGRPCGAVRRRTTESLGRAV